MGFPSWRMTAFQALRILLGLLCLNESLRPGIAAVFYCRNLNVSTGALVTTRPYNTKLWCGEPQGKFLAVARNTLFFLQCRSGDPKLKEATAAIFETGNATGGTTIFEQDEVCEVVQKNLQNPTKAEALAYMLDGITVPFNCQTCNANHYFEYLAKGQMADTYTVSSSCPVYHPFNSYTNINQSFRLARKDKALYKWPGEPNTGKLSLPKIGKEYLTSSPQRTGGDTRSGTPWAPNTRYANDTGVKKVQAVERRSRGGRGGGVSSGGGDSGVPATGTTTGTYPTGNQAGQQVGANSGRPTRSGASGIRPFGGLKLSNLWGSFSRVSFGHSPTPSSQYQYARLSGSR
ncbi:uncharacterized protein [Bemisia tabaci]|uniref:uncharacterized protein n=1 Tax=Bemisia tabaci TaxID=7038 RepID=UPI003B28A16C